MSEPPEWLRPVEIVLGILSIAVALTVLLNPSYGMSTILSLLAYSLVIYAVRMFLAGGASGSVPSLRLAGLAGGAVVAAIAATELLSPGLGLPTLVTLFASALAVEGLDRLANSLNRARPRWFRVSAFTVGGLTLALAGTAIALPSLAHFSLVALLTITITLTGAESIISGIRPSSPKQVTLIKLIAFAMFYGFVNINWIDLYYNQVPGYHVWLILTYMAPFGVLLVFQGFKDWQLALSLGLLVSLMNDLGYYFSGDLLFGFHVDLVNWLAGQLGLLGTKTLFTFQAGLFTFPVSSYLMGFSIYARVVVVFTVLYHWWRRPMFR